MTKEREKELKNEKLNTELNIAIYKTIRRSAKLEILEELQGLFHIADFSIDDYIENEINFMTNYKLIKKI
tara:strand:+ start:70 stop:279 length:210 start_codon:yes stop_codon:yes gene_type:complete